VSDNLATLHNRPAILAAPDGEERPQADLTLNDLGDLQQWAVAQQPDPFAIAREQLAAGDYSMEQERFILRTAMEVAASRRPPELNSPEFRAAVNGPGGTREMIWLSLRAADPTLSRTVALAFIAKLDEAAIAQAVSRITVREMFGGPSGPKAGGLATPTSRAG
jgi:hypothetical protein